MTSDEALAAALLAVDPAGLGGAALRSAAGPARDDWLALLRRLLPPQTPWRRMPLNIHDAALLGGLDLGATLQAGRPVLQQGLLAQCDGGLVVLPMAERLTPGLAARLAGVLDTGEVAVERDGLALRLTARLALLALDEGQAGDERISDALADRLAFHLFLDQPLERVAADGSRSAAAADADEPVDWQDHDVAQARLVWPRVTASSDIVQALCAAAQALGVASLRAPLLALRAARAAAALAGLNEVEPEHAALAARLVLAPRATRVPAPPEDPPADQPADEQLPDQAQPPDSPASDPADAPPPEANADSPAKPAEPPPPMPDEDDDSANLAALAENVLAAAQAAIPPGLLAALKAGPAQRSRGSAGRSGAARKSQTRGRPVGARSGEPRAGARLDLLETLRAAAPWQKLRTEQAGSARTAINSGANGRPTQAPRIQVRREDFHITRYRQVGQTTTVFVVDASGSSAINRLAEAKGAVELLLADCYVRRDQVAVLAFRGKGAELLLPPTRSLARAKRSLAGLPGGGGTPLAAGLAAAWELSASIRRRGETPIVVLLTDGRANVARDGSPGRAQAAQDALTMARQLRADGISTLLLDTSPQPQDSARELARAMGANYLPLPYAGAQLLSQAVRAATASGPVPR